MRNKKKIRRLALPIIKPRDSGERVIRSFRIKKILDAKLHNIMEKTGETKTYVVESLLEFAIKQWERENDKKSDDK